MNPSVRDLAAQMQQKIQDDKKIEAVNPKRVLRRRFELEDFYLKRKLMAEMS